MEVQPTSAHSFDYESFHKTMNEKKVQTAQVKLMRIMMTLKSHKVKILSRAAVVSIDKPCS